LIKTTPIRIKYKRARWRASSTSLLSMCRLWIPGDMPGWTVLWVYGSMCMGSGNKLNISASVGSTKMWFRVCLNPTNLKFSLLGLLNILNIGYLQNRLHKSDLIHETNLLSIINPSSAQIYYSTTWSNHELIRLNGFVS
jgi:hypothetical protein